MHEHIQTSSAGVAQNYRELLGAGFMDRIVTGLTKAKEGGINTIVDATTLDLGRDVNILAEASRRTGVNIIATTGFYLEPLRLLSEVSADQFAQLFVREIQEGIAGSDIKPGILKAASDIAGVTQFGETVLRAVARAHLQTHIPILLHSYSPGQVGRQQLAILKEEGVELRRVKVDHCSDTVDLEYLTWLLEQGCYLGMERLPGRNPSPLARAKTIKVLLDAGYADRILPSHDWLLVWLREFAANSPISREEREKFNPHGFLYIKKVLFPQLREMGVSEATLGRLCVDGPRKFFEGT
jgi:phosphotriesterase-related protein